MPLLIMLWPIWPMIALEVCLVAADPRSWVRDP